jgi:hypothetical protein
MPRLARRVDAMRMQSSTWSRATEQGVFQKSMKPTKVIKLLSAASRCEVRTGPSTWWRTLGARRRTAPRSRQAPVVRVNATSFLLFTPSSALLTIYPDEHMPEQAPVSCGLHSNG